MRGKAQKTTKYNPNLPQNCTEPGSVPPPAVYYAPSTNYPTSNPAVENGNKKNEIVDTLTTVAKAAGSAATSASRKVKNMIDAQSLKGMLKDGNIVQLVSLSSGKTIQILQTEDGQLILDGQGSIGTQFFNAHFNVCKDPVDHGLRLHNQFNYLAIVNGTVALIHQDGRQKAHPATRFKVKADNGNSIQFESVQERRSFIEVTPNGKVRSSAHGSMDSADAQFSINIICKV